MLLRAEPCAPHISVQHCSGPGEQINSTALVVEPSQHNQQVGCYERIHLYRPGAPVLLSEKSLFVAFHLLSWLKEASASILSSKAAAPSLHTSLHVCGMEGLTSGSSLHVPKLCLASVLELCGGSRLAQPLAGAVGSLRSVAITLFAVCSAWEHMALSGLFVCFRIFLFLSILVYCHK